MKALWTAIAILLGVASLVGCVKAGMSSETPAGGEAPAMGSGGAGEQSESSTQFFSYFQYEVISDSTCDYAGPLPVAIAPLVDGVKSYGGGRAQLLLIISPNGLVQERYTEHDEKGVLIKQTAHMSTWAIDGEEIVFKGLGRGQRALLGGEKVIRLLVNTDSSATLYRGLEVDVSKLRGECHHQ